MDSFDNVDQSVLASTLGIVTAALSGTNLSNNGPLFGLDNGENSDDDDDDDDDNLENGSSYKTYNSNSNYTYLAGSSYDDPQTSPVSSSEGTYTTTSQSKPVEEEKQLVVSTGKAEHLNAQASSWFSAPKKTSFVEFKDIGSYLDRLVVHGEGRSTQASKYYNVRLIDGIPENRLYTNADKTYYPPIFNINFDAGISKARESKNNKASIVSSGYYEILGSPRDVSEELAAHISATNQRLRDSIKDTKTNKPPLFTSTDGNLLACVRIVEHTKIKTTKTKELSIHCCKFENGKIVSEECSIESEDYTGYSGMIRGSVKIDSCLSGRVGFAIKLICKEIMLMKGEEQSVMGINVTRAPKSDSLSNVLNMFTKLSLNDYQSSNLQSMLSLIYELCAAGQDMGQVYGSLTSVKNNTLATGQNSKKFGSDSFSPYNQGSIPSYVPEVPQPVQPVQPPSPSKRSKNGVTEELLNSLRHLVPKGVSPEIFAEIYLETMKQQSIAAKQQQQQQRANPQMFNYSNAPQPKFNNKN